VRRFEVKEEAGQKNTKHKRMKKKHTINKQANKRKKLIHKFWNEKREDTKLVLSQSRF